MGILKKKLASASIVETVAALLIITIVLRISTSIVFQTVASGVPLERLKARSVLRKALQDVKTQNDLSLQEKQLDGYAIRTEVVRFYNSQSAEVRISVYDSSGKFMEARRHVVLLNPDR